MKPKTKKKSAPKERENVNPLPDLYPPSTPPKEPPLCYSCHKHGHHANNCGSKPSKPKETNHHPDRSIRYDEGGDEE